MQTRRRWLIGISLVVHVVIVLALFVAGFWRIDRLEPGKRAFDLAVAPEPPPPPSGSPAAPQTTPFKLKQQKKIIKELTQPEKIEDKTPVDETPPGIGTGTGSGNGSGSGSGSGEGPCTTPPCGPGEAKEPAFDASICNQQATVFVPPAVIKGMRISGETQIYPSDLDKTAIAHSGKPKVTAMFKVCVASTGAVATITKTTASGYDSWDRAIMAALQNWRYRPYQLAPAQYTPPDPRCPKRADAVRAVPVCGMVSFIYEIH